MNWETEEIPVGKFSGLGVVLGTCTTYLSVKVRPEAVMSRCQSIRLIGVQEGTLLKDDDTRNLRKKKSRT